MMPAAAWKLVLSESVNIQIGLQRNTLQVFDPYLIRLTILCDFTVRLR